MNEENNNPILDDIEYTAPAPKKGAPQGVAAAILDDDNYVPPTTEKKGAPQGVAAVVLDDDDSYTQTAKPQPQKLIMTDEEIIAGLTPEQKVMFDGLPEEKQKQIIDMRRSQLGAEAPAPVLEAPVLDDDNYVPPVREEKPKEPEAPIEAPILDEEPELPKYTPTYVDEDLERAKQEAKKKAVSSQLQSDQKDSKESLRMMLELKEQQRQEKAKKGFKIVIVIGILGVIAAAAFLLLYSGSLGLSYKEGMSGMSNAIKESAVYIAMAMGVSALLLLTGVGFFKSLTSLIFILSGIVQIFPGIVMIPQHEGSKPLAIILYAVSLICTVAAFFMLNSSEEVGLFFKKNKS